MNLDQIKNEHMFIFRIERKIVKKILEIQFISILIKN